MAYFARGAFRDDPWRTREILSLADFRDRDPDALPSPLGLKLEPGADAAAIASDIGKFALITISFPKFTDGRGYSMGWLLRRRFAYLGEMRAVGDILFDEMQFMLRCGFDTFEISDAATLRLLQDGRRAAAFDHFYQPGLGKEIPAGTRPWARRPALPPEEPSPTPPVDDNP